MADSAAPPPAASRAANEAAAPSAAPTDGRRATFIPDFLRAVSSGSSMFGGSAKSLTSEKSEEEAEPDWLHRAYSSIVLEHHHQTPEEILMAEQQAEEEAKAANARGLAPLLKDTVVAEVRALKAKAVAAAARFKAAKDIITGADEEAVTEDAAKAKAATAEAVAEMATATAMVTTAAAAVADQSRALVAAARAVEPLAAWLLLVSICLVALAAPMLVAFSPAAAAAPSTGYYYVSTALQYAHGACGQLTTTSGWTSLSSLCGAMAVDGGERARAQAAYEMRSLGACLAGLGMLTLILALSEDKRARRAGAQALALVSATQLIALLLGVLGGASMFDSAWQILLRLAAHLAFLGATFAACSLPTWRLAADGESSAIVVVAAKPVPAEPPALLRSQTSMEAARFLGELDDGEEGLTGGSAGGEAAVAAEQVVTFGGLTRPVPLIKAAGTFKDSVHELAAEL